MACQLSGHGGELYRERIYRKECPGILDFTCDFCGTVLQTKMGSKYLYRYFTVSAMGKKAYIKGIFCGIECKNAYHMDYTE